MLRNHVLSALIATVLCLRGESLLQSEDWLQFRGPQGQGASQDAKIPTQWSATENVAWKAELPGAGFSSPIVVGDLVFVTCYSGTPGSDLARHLVCIQRADGKTRWSQKIEGRPSERAQSSFALHGFASHTPVSDGERIYVLFGNSGLLAFDLTGKELWKQDVGEENAARFGSGSSPVLYKNLVIATVGAESESVRAYDKVSGKEVWKTEAGPLSSAYNTPALAKTSQGEDELLIAAPYEIWGLNPQTGKLKWYAETSIDTAACPSIVVNGEIAYAIGGRSGARAAVRVGGKDDVTDSHRLWSHRGGSYVPSPIFHDGKLYWVNDSGIATCIDAKTGEELNRKRIRGRFYASALLIGDKIYVVSRFGGTHVLSATPEMKELALNDLGDESDFSGSPAVSNGQLFLRSDKALYCIQAK